GRDRPCHLERATGPFSVRVAPEANRIRLARLRTTDSRPWQALQVAPHNRPKVGATRAVTKGNAPSKLRSARAHCRSQYFNSALLARRRPLENALKYLHEWPKIFVES